jgi:hypothetical protein
MKHRNLLLALVGLPVLFCGGCSDAFGKVVTSTDDFLTVAADSEFQIASAALKTATGRSNNNNSSSTSLASSASSGTESVGHDVKMFTNGDYSLTDGKETTIGYTRITGSLTEYFLIDGATSKGMLTPDAADLTPGRTSAQKLIDNDYATLRGIYDGLKGYIGKSASDYPNMTSLSLTRSIAGTTAGYYLHTFEETSSARTETSVYLTLDQFKGKWAFTNYSKRLTVVSKGSDGLTTYNITEYAIDVQDELSAMSVPLAGISVYIKGIDTSGVSFTNGIPLTAK